MEQNFYLKKINQYIEEQQKCIETAMKILEEIEQEPLMLLGRVQSGKTSIFLGLTRLCFDKGYDIAIVFTKVNIGLTVQTTCRMKSEFMDERVKILDIMEVDTDFKLTSFECRQKMIIVVKKQKDNFLRLKKFIEGNDLYNKKVLIVDDEADYASMGFRREKDAIDFRKIANELNILRDRLKKWSYVQVTATPYSVYLQPEVFDIGKKVYSIRPGRTVLVPCGVDYIGGEFFFNTEKNPLAKYFFREIEEDELDAFKADIYNPVFKMKEIAGIRDALINFAVGGVIRILQNGGDIYSSKNRFSMIVHTESMKAPHKKQSENIDKIIQALQETIEIDYQEFRRLIKKSINQLRESVEAYGFECPNEEQIIEETKIAIFDYIKITEVNSDRQIKNLLNVKGELELVTPLNIFVGGQILDRGITIANLIAFYYGRRPKNPQQDTMIQHLRIFGYRNKKDLAVTRIYTTQDIYTNLQIANETDELLRKNIEEFNVRPNKYKKLFEVILVNRDERKIIKPTSNVKVSLSRLLPVEANSRHLPIVRDTKQITKKISVDIEKILKRINPQYTKDDNGVVVSLEIALSIIESCYKSLILSNQEKVDKETMISLITQLAKTKEVIIMTKLGGKLNRISKKGTYAHAPDHPEKAKELAVDKPVIILIQQLGTTQLGWDGDAPFWWPVLITPQNTETSIYARTSMK